MKPALLLTVLFVSFSILSFSQPVITSFSPASGGENTSVTITGTGFNGTISNNKVYVGGVPAVVSSASTTQLIITIPAAAAGKGKIAVTNIATNLRGESRNEFVRTFAGGIASSAAITGQFPSSSIVTGPNLNGEGTSWTFGFKSVTGDFDRDGKVDFAEMGTDASLSMTVFSNIGTSGWVISSSSFSSVATLTLDANSKTVYSSAADINNDGLLDILVSRTNGFTVFVNTSSGPGNFSFSKTTYTPSSTFYSTKSVLVDLDKDGRLDIASINPGVAGISYYKNTSSGGTLGFNIVPVNITVSESIADIIAADLDNDGDNDIIISSNSGSANQSVYYNLNTNATAGTISMSASCTVLYGALPKGSYNYPVPLATADFDGDGDIDIASVANGGVVSAGGWIYIHRNDGSLSFSSFATGNFTSTNNITYNLKTSDLNGDGKIDLVLAHQNSGGLYSVLNNYTSGTLTTANFANISTFTSSHITASLAIDDFNNDGKVDVLSAQYYNTNLNFYTNFISAYYPKVAGASALQTLSNWSATLDGSGSAPANFSSPNSFYLTNSSGTTSFGISGALTVGGQFTIPSGATLALGANNFTVSGVLNHAGTITSSTGITTLNGSTAQTITGGGSFGALTINNSNDVTLTGNTTVNGALTFTAGKLDIGNNTLTLGSSVTGASSTAYIKTSGSGTIKKSIANAGSFAFPVGNTTYNPVTITNNTGSTDDFTVRVLDEVYVNGSNGTPVSQAHVQRTWDIGKTNANGGSGVSFVFNWNNGETSAAITTPALYHYTSSWSQQGSSSFTSNSLTYNGYTGTFSPFAIAQAGITLPVTWVGISAQQRASDVVLQWSTAMESNSKDYTIQRSTDGLNWDNIGTVAAAGNSSNTQNYSFTDQAPATGKNYYRVRQNDADGKQNFSSIVPVLFTPVVSNLLSVYPNPVVNGTLVVKLSQPSAIQVFNMAGVRVIQKSLQAGNHSLDLRQLTRGVYRIKAGEEIISFIVQ